MRVTHVLLSWRGKLFIYTLVWVQACTLTNNFTHKCAYTHTKCLHVGAFYQCHIACIYSSYFVSLLQILVRVFPRAGLGSTDYAVNRAKYRGPMCGLHVTCVGHVCHTRGPVCSNYMTLYIILDRC